MGQFLQELHDDAYDAAQAEEQLTEWQRVEAAAQADAAAKKIAQAKTAKQKKAAEAELADAIRRRRAAEAKSAATGYQVEQAGKKKKKKPTPVPVPVVEPDLPLLPPLVPVVTKAPLWPWLAGGAAVLAIGGGVLYAVTRRRGV